MASPVAERLVIMPIELPIIVKDKSGSDLTVYKSVGEAESALEVIDVINSEYVAYDARGRLLTLTVVERKWPLVFGFVHIIRKVVRIRPAENEPEHGEDLRSALIRYVVYCRHMETAYESATIEQLISDIRVLNSPEDSGTP